MVSDESKRVIVARIKELESERDKKQSELDLVLPDLQRYIDKRDAISSKIQEIDAVIADMNKDIKEKKNA